MNVHNMRAPVGWEQISQGKSGQKTRNQDWNLTGKGSESHTNNFEHDIFLLVVIISKQILFIGYYLSNTYQVSYTLSLIFISTLKCNCNHSHIICRETEDRRDQNFSKYGSSCILICGYEMASQKLKDLFVVNLEDVGAFEYQNMRNCLSRLRERPARQQGSRKLICDPEIPLQVNFKKKICFNVFFGVYVHFFFPSWGRSSMEETEAGFLLLNWMNILKNSCIFIKRQHNVNFSLVSGAHVKCIC